MLTFEWVLLHVQKYFPLLESDASKSKEQKLSL
jgi:hypothetical protein